jgi:uncharacterized membrane protein YkoI
MKLRILLAGIAFAALASVPAHADPRDRGRPDLGSTFTPHEARDVVQQGRHVPLRGIYSQIQSRYPGRPLGEPQLERGQPAIYVIDWLTADGRKLTIRANAENGAILGVSGG